MKNIKIFILHGCPYCHNAMKAWKELTSQENYRGMTAEWIYEDEHPEAARDYDHYYCPSIFVDGKKVYEAHPHDSYEVTFGKVREALDLAR